MEKETKKGVHIVSEQGAAMMTLEGFGRDGDLMSVQGALMGSWSTKMFVYPEEVLTMIGFLFNWQVIGYMLSLPYILIRRRHQN